MRRLYLARAVGVLALLGALFYKNDFSYPKKSPKWKCVKSSADCALIVLSANYFPALLVSWAVLLVTRKIRSMGLRVTAAVLCGFAFNTIGGVALEVLCALSVVSVDLVTGANGIYGNWKVQPPPEFLAWARARKSQSGMA